jgi:hypothetical protein
MDTARLRAELGYAEPVPRDEALRLTVAWQRAHPPPPGRFPSEAQLRARFADEDRLMETLGGRPA